MKALILTLFFAAVALAQKVHPDIARIVDTVNSHPNATWHAGLNSRFAYMESMDEAKRYMGTLRTPVELRLPVLKHEVNLAAIPDSFDARTNWPECPSIAEVRDQSSCGSCWAFGAVEAATDRICISTKGAVQTHLSADHLLSCCWTCGMGCNGGYPSAAWSWFKSSGVVSGGNYGDYSYCSAYPFAPCDHHVTGKYGPCPASEYPTPQCPSSCDKQTSYNVTFANDKHKFKSSYSISSDVSQIQTEIMTNGPVEAAFTVYEDFTSYKSGVYKHITGSELGGHAIRILGWGTDNGTPYWIVANSWNEGWGNNGFFNIARGNDECGIEDEIVAGLYQ